MACLYDGFDIESFEAGKGLWHARIRRADQQPVVIDGISLPRSTSASPGTIPRRRSPTPRAISIASGCAARERQMPSLEVVPTTSTQLLSACPECSGGMALLKIIPAAQAAAAAILDMRCTRCGGIHLDIVEQAGAPAA